MSSVAPASIFPGDPVTVTGTATGLNPKKKASYTYTSTGGVVSASGETATIDTKGLAAGSYTVSGTVREVRSRAIWQAARLHLR